ncbi:hypothetical protein M9H77_26684 [Catharanthus roseus]|uniref:Uncharacterized protein n=1 Tax=Catharanthus roseus TaxID=4058 RepID=A0ACC0ABC6_CATRO|nr:hypothetical protein M9H77_26684 [Catharanthus roseus]
MQEEKEDDDVILSPCKKKTKDQQDAETNPKEGDDSKKEKNESAKVGESKKIDLSILQQYSTSFFKFFRESIDVARKSMTEECVNNINAACDSLAIPCEDGFKSLLQDICKHVPDFAELENATSDAQPVKPPTFDKTPVLRSGDRATVPSSLLVPSGQLFQMIVAHRSSSMLGGLAIE